MFRFGIALVILLIAACGDVSEDEVRDIVRSEVGTAIASVPTVTPIPTPTSISTFKDIYDEARLSVVLIVTDSGFGTGWAIEDNWIITAHHVVEGSSTVEVEIPSRFDGTTTELAQVVGYDVLRDIAAIEINTLVPALGTRELFTEDTGEPVISIGYSSGSPGFPSIRQGVVTTVFEFVDLELGAVETDAAFDPGDSGGPLLDSGGRVVGIVQAQTVETVGGQRVLGQQRALEISEALEVWDQLKNGEKTDSLFWWWELS